MKGLRKMNDDYYILKKNTHTHHKLSNAGFPKYGKRKQLCRSQMPIRKNWRLAVYLGVITYLESGKDVNRILSH